MQSIIEGINTFTGPESNCTCLGLEAPLIDVSDGLDKPVCAQPAADNPCAERGKQSCLQIANICNLAADTIIEMADFDLDGDGTNDAISTFFRFEAAPATLLGIAPE